MYKTKYIDKFPSTYQGLLKATKSKETVLVFQDYNIIAVYRGSYYSIYYGMPNGVPYCTDFYWGRLFNSSLAVYDNWDVSRVCRASACNQKTTEHNSAIDNMVAQINAQHSEIKETGKNCVIDMGVELELESARDYGKVRRQNLQNTLTTMAINIVDAVVYDGSVRGNLEMRLIHQDFPKWDKAKIGELLTYAKKIRLNNRTHTAGMHVHLSCPDEKATRLVGHRLASEWDKAIVYLYPICGRNKYIRGIERERGYGLESDITRGFTSHHTAELRCFEATRNTDVFYARLKFCDYLFRFLCMQEPWDQFFKKMTQEDKDNYKFLVNTENPHHFGMGRDAVLKEMEE